MTIVTLEDGTTYLIDTDNSFMARDIVEHKLRNRADYRRIASANVFEDCTIKPDSKYYNSGKWGDSNLLKCKTGWSYKW